MIRKLIAIAAAVLASAQAVNIESKSEAQGCYVWGIDVCKKNG